MIYDRNLHQSDLYFLLNSQRAGFFRFHLWNKLLSPRQRLREDETR